MIKTKENQHDFSLSNEFFFSYVLAFIFFHHILNHFQLPSDFGKGGD